MPINDWSLIYSSRNEHQKHIQQASMHADSHKMSNLIITVHHPYKANHDERKWTTTLLLRTNWVNILWPPINTNWSLVVFPQNRSKSVLPHHLTWECPCKKFSLLFCKSGDTWVFKSKQLTLEVSMDSRIWPQEQSLGNYHCCRPIGWRQAWIKEEDNLYHCIT